MTQLFSGQARVAVISEKSRTELSPARYSLLTLLQDLEREFHSQLHRAWPAGANCGIGSSNVRRRAAATKRTNRRIVQAKSILTAVRIGKVRMVENVEELDAGLEPHGFSKMEIFGQ